VQNVFENERQIFRRMLCASEQRLVKLTPGRSNPTGKTCVRVVLEYHMGRQIVIYSILCIARLQMFRVTCLKQRKAITYKTPFSVMLFLVDG